MVAQPKRATVRALRERRRYVGIAGGCDGSWPSSDADAVAPTAEGSASYALTSRIFAIVASNRGCEISPASISSNAVLPSSS